MCPYVRKEKHFINDLSQKTSDYSSWTRATLTCMEAGMASIGFSGLYRRCQEGRRGLGMAIQHPISGVCHKYIISLGYIWGGGGAGEVVEASIKQRSVTVMNFMKGLLGNYF